MSLFILEQRYKVQILKSQGPFQKDNAVETAKDTSDVSGELKRNCNKESLGYRAVIADKKCSKLQESIQEK